MIVTAALNSNSRLLEMKTFVTASECCGQNRSLMENIFERNTRDSCNTP